MRTTVYSGFSLVELSIVLVIIGLLVGGITVGQDMIKAAELRSVITEQQRYVTAALTFKDKYMALPGDMKNAEDFWGQAAAGAACKTTVGTGTQTCNGNGNGMVENSTGTANAQEWFRFWQHLANAGITEGQFTGVTGAGGPDDAVVGTNVPESKISAVGCTAKHQSTITAGHATAFAGEYGNGFLCGMAQGTAATNEGFLTPEDLWSVDAKADDGKPGMGDVVARNWDTCTLAAANTNTDAAYDLTNSNKDCAIHFREQF